MCCDDYPGGVVLTAPSNTRLKLTGADRSSGNGVFCPNRARTSDAFTL